MPDHHPDSDDVRRLLDGYAAPGRARRLHQRQQAGRHRLLWRLGRWLRRRPSRSSKRR